MIAAYNAVQTFARPKGRSMTQQMPRPGRPKSRGETLEDRAIGFKPSVLAVLEPMAQEQDISVPELVRRAVDAMLNPRPVEIKDEAFNSFRAPYLSAVPCGPWSEAIDRAEAFTISTESADEIEAQDGDIWVRANGQSMTCAGIVDGVLVLVRPYGRKVPRRGDIVLVQTTDENGETLGTLKRFDGMDGELPRLLDGEGNPFSLPAGAQNPQIIARAVGVHGQL